MIKNENEKSMANNPFGRPKGRGIWRRKLTGRLFDMHTNYFNHYFDNDFYFKEQKDDCHILELDKAEVKI